MSEIKCHCSSCEIESLRQHNQSLTEQLKSAITDCDEQAHFRIVAEAQLVQITIERDQLKEAMETAKAALHHCDIRHKKCSCSREALDEIAALAKADRMDGQ